MSSGAWGLLPPASCHHRRPHMHPVLPTPLAPSIRYSVVGGRWWRGGRENLRGGRTGVEGRWQRRGCPLYGLCIAARFFMPSFFVFHCENFFVSIANDTPPPCALDPILSGGRRRALLPAHVARGNLREPVGLAHRATADASGAPERTVSDGSVSARGWALGALQRECDRAPTKAGGGQRGRGRWQRPGAPCMVCA